MFEWVSTTSNAPIITLYQNNFTLNSTAASYFENSEWCCVGINKEEKKIALRPVTKREIDLNLIPSHQLHKVSIGKGYGRISNKDIASEVCELLKINGAGEKFHATFDEKEKMLIVDLNDQVRR